jgi:hypothetical protein
VLFSPAAMWILITYLGEGMKYMRGWAMRILGFTCMLCSAAVFAGTPAPKTMDIRDLMNVTQFDKAGLNKLTPEEIKALNAWLNQYLNACTATPVKATASRNAASLPVAASSTAGFGADSMTPKESPLEPARMETRIAGLFTGWTGDTVFKLENGQIWKQAATGYFTNVELDHPEVVIKKLSFGYLLTLPGHGETVFVRRIK